MSKLLMPKGTTVWLIDNTTLTFKQIADFVEMHELEVKAFADGETGTNIIPIDPISKGFLTKKEIDRCQENDSLSLKITENKSLDKIQKKKSKVKYTPISKRGAKPNAIAWLIKHFPTIKDNQIKNLIGTTKGTIDKIKTDEEYYKNNVDNPNSPVELGLCSKNELDALIKNFTAEEIE